VPSLLDGLKSPLPWAKIFALESIAIAANLPMPPHIRQRLPKVEDKLPPIQPGQGGLHQAMADFQNQQQPPKADEERLYRALLPQFLRCLPEIVKCAFGAGVIGGEAGTSEEEKKAWSRDISNSALAALERLPALEWEEFFREYPEEGAEFMDWLDQMEPDSIWSPSAAGEWLPQRLSSIRAPSQRSLSEPRELLTTIRAAHRKVWIE
jgi:hypothetical protein